MNFLTVNEFAERLKLHPGTIRKAIKEGKIFAARLNIGIRSHYRIPESEFERLHLKSMCEQKK